MEYQDDDDDDRDDDDDAKASSDSGGGEASGAEGPCRAKIGLLVLRDCGAPSRTECVLCSRGLCGEHRQKGTEGDLCPECALTQGAPIRTASLARAHQRHRFYAEHHYRPWFYHRHYGHSTTHDGYFDDYDHRTFDTERHVEHDPMAEAAVGLEDTEEGKDWLGIDDLGES